MSVLTLADAKIHLNITGTTSDTELQAVIDAAEAAIGQVVGSLTPTTITRRIPGASLTLVLPVTPVISLTSVTPVGASAVTIGDLYLDTALGIVRYDLTQRPFPYPWYTVVYQAGWDTDTVPDDLLSAIKELVRHFWKTQRGTSGRPGSIESTEMSNKLPGAAYSFPIRVSQLLAPHRTVVAG